MELYTSSLYNRSVVEAQGLELMDVTIKTGAGWLAPDWGFLREYLDSDKGVEAEVRYTKQYLEKMRESFRRYPSRWRGLLSKDRLCIGCYCHPGKFCHRLILVDLLGKVAKQWDIPFHYQGEIAFKRNKQCKDS